MFHYYFFIFQSHLSFIRLSIASLCPFNHLFIHYFDTFLITYVLYFSDICVDPIASQRIYDLLVIVFLHIFIYYLTFDLSIGFYDELTDFTGEKLLPKNADCGSGEQLDTSKTKSVSDSKIMLKILDVCKYLFQKVLHKKNNYTGIKYLAFYLCTNR